MTEEEIIEFNIWKRRKSANRKATEKPEATELPKAEQPEAVVDLLYALVKKKIAAGEIEIYFDALKVCRIEFKFGKRAEPFELSDPRVKYVLASFARDAAEIGRPSDSELGQVVRDLSGEAIRNNPKYDLTDEAALHFLETEPLGPIVLAYVDSLKSPRLEIKVGPFHEALKAFAKDHSYPLQVGKRKFPALPNILSKSLKKHHDVFEALGVCISLLDRTNGRPMVIEKKNPSGTSGPVVPAPAKPSTPLPEQHMGSENAAQIELEAKSRDLNPQTHATDAPIVQASVEPSTQNSLTEQGLSREHATKTELDDKPSELDPQTSPMDGSIVQPSAEPSAQNSLSDQDLDHDKATENQLDANRTDLKPKTQPQTHS